MRLREDLFRTVCPVPTTCAFGYLLTSVSIELLRWLYHVFKMNGQGPTIDDGSKDGGKIMEN